MPLNANALLASDLGAGAAGPGGRRVGIDDPYVGPKALLLAGIAEANRCKAVWSQDGVPRVVFRFTLAGGTVAAIDMLADPEVLAGLAIEPL